MSGKTFDGVCGSKEKTGMPIAYFRFFVYRSTRGGFSLIIEPAHVKQLNDRVQHQAKA